MDIMNRGKVVLILHRFVSWILIYREVKRFIIMISSVNIFSLMHQILKLLKKGWRKEGHKLHKLFKRELLMPKNKLKKVNKWHFILILQMMISINASKLYLTSLMKLTKSLSKNDCLNDYIYIRKYHNYLTITFSLFEPSKTYPIILSFLSLNVIWGKLCFKSKSLNFYSNYSRQ